ncbi:type III-A CRISPR-associated RAMP protein Csm5 [Fusobacterium hominis]|uniref:type III-A CRISPR-associated RAMP protein Csm5 n=1 Tax=Fusobacterium hominis TaxID=2764326 RepID=UPI0022E8CD23|nr:type III-A CRISPR-associated RAMP protein Csm5 [Fusobacterium hominis]
MNEYLKVYDMKITVKSPIHIGSSQILTKKEYLNDEKDSVSVIDLNKMFSYIIKKNLLNEYKKYVLTPFKSLNQWIHDMQIPKTEYDKWKKYKLKKGDAFLSNNQHEKSEKSINCFIKDAYGMPFIPGSSLKGMIKTALIVYEVEKNKKRFEIDKNKIRNSIFQENNYRQYYLASVNNDFQAQIFNTLEKDKKNKKRAINSNMSGLIIGDSNPITTNCLSLYQKIDYRKNGEEKKINLLRECLRPETEIFFTISLDTKIFPYTIEEIMEALDTFNEEIYYNYYSKFNKGSLDKGTIWLGGGAGFITKTILHPLFKKDATKIIKEVFIKTKNKGNFFTKDILPYVTKCTKDKRKLVDMGRGKIEILKKDS